jgi:hypothetical protein
MSQNIDLAGNNIIVDGVYVGASTPGSAGTLLSGSEISVLDNVTAGTAAASKAVVLDSSKGIATITSATVTTLTAPTIAGATTMSGVVTFGSNPTFAAGKTLDLDSGTATLSSNAATVTKYANLITSESLTTAAGSSQAFVLTLTGVAAGDFAFVQGTGAGTNTRMNHTYKAVCTTDTVTVTVFNNEPVNALNGTLKFNLMVFKA